jgi:hypothetical protein
MRSTVLGAALCLNAASAAADNKADGTWWWAYQTGVMTDGRASEALQPWRTEFVDYYMIGLSLGYDLPIANSNFTIGAEIQTNAHFGNQGYYELVGVPIALRYHPDNSWWGAFESFAFGLGYSHNSELSRLELDNYDGETRRNLFYWYLEVEFAELAPGDSFFMRLHHRSNAYDTVTPNGGSNALIVGFRRGF